MSKSVIYGYATYKGEFISIGSLHAAKCYATRNNIKTVYGCSLYSWQCWQVAEKQNGKWIKR